MTDPRPQPAPDGGATDAIPVAQVVPARRFALVWLIPIAALLVAGALAYNAIAGRGPTVTIEFRNGHDIKPNDPISHRGVEVGRVRAVTLAPDLRHVLVTADLSRDATGLAVTGTQFWIVRPQLSLTRIAGVETLLGPRYIALRPGDGAARRRFTGLDEPPVESGLTGGGLVVVLESPRAGSLHVGSPVYYRDVEVGAVTDTRLGPDAANVEIVAEIAPQYAPLVRQNSRFWKVGGIGVDVGFGGLSFQADSLSSLITGGVGFATPNRPGDAVSNGQRFQLADKPDDSWLKWAPALSAGPPAQ